MMCLELQTPDRPPGDFNEAHESSPVAELGCEAIDNEVEMEKMKTWSDKSRKHFWRSWRARSLTYQLMALVADANP